MGIFRRGREALPPRTEIHTEKPAIDTQSRQPEEVQVVFRSEPIYETLRKEGLIVEPTVSLVSEDGERFEEAMVREPDPSIPGRFSEMRRLVTFLSDESDTPRPVPILEETNYRGSGRFLAVYVGDDEAIAKRIDTLFRRLQELEGQSRDPDLRREALEIDDTLTKMVKEYEEDIRALSFPGLMSDEQPTARRINKD